MSRCSAALPQQARPDRGGADYNPTFILRMAKSTTPPPAAPPPASYEDALRELERLVAGMEGGQLPLDQMIDSYRRGAELLAFCRGRLEAVEAQVKVLEDGQLKPWSGS
jgi:exodeoxyribonuclease VII small subunit